MMKSHELKQGAPVAEKVKWDALFLVCTKCRKRKNGPDDLKPKSLIAAASRQMKKLQPRPRAVLTSCLGLCPNKAVAVAFVGGGLGEPRIVAVTSVTQLDAAMPYLLSADRLHVCRK